MFPQLKSVGPREAIGASYLNTDEEVVTTQCATDIRPLQHLWVVGSTTPITTLAKVKLSDLLVGWGGAGGYALLGWR